MVRGLMQLIIEGSNVRVASITYRTLHILEYDDDCSR